MRLLEKVVCLLALLTPLGCGGGGSPATLNCDAYCNVTQCGGNTCDRNQCPCFGSVIRDEVRDGINECGRKTTCSDVMACQTAQPEPSMRAVDQQLLDACYQFSGRCAQDGSICGLYSGLSVIYDEDRVKAQLGCFSMACDQVDACFKGAQTPQCS